MAVAPQAGSGAGASSGGSQAMTDVYITTLAAFADMSMTDTTTIINEEAQKTASTIF
ncbi:MAG: hypothetical protein R2932_40420 [Caldilineaceae bacterium]